MFNHKRSIRLGDAIRTFLSELRMADRAESTIQLYAWLLSRLRREVGDIELDAISGETLAEYLTSVGGSQSYHNLTVRLLKRFLSWATENDHAKANPLAHVSVRADRWLPVVPFTSDECQRLLSAVRSPFERLLVLLLLDTGMRASELAGLRLRDIDLETNEIVIDGKGGKHRCVALTSGPRKALLDYLASRVQVNGLLWPKGFNRKSLAYILDKIARRAKVAGVHPHRFRHTFACRFLLETNDALALQEICGWSSLAMVARYTAWVQARRAIGVHRGYSGIGDGRRNEGSF